jgi:4-alpha-glucanotransferase
MAALINPPQRDLLECLSDISECADVRAGSPHPLGTHESGGGANFAIFSPNARRVRLELFNQAKDVAPIQFLGTRVFQFEFGSELQNNSHPPATYPLETVVYSRTHDNGTTDGWYEKLLGSQQEALQNKLRASDREIIWAVIRTALASPANPAIIPAQDLLELVPEARMNLPGIAKDNCGWRPQAGVLTEKLTHRLRSLTLENGRQMDGKLVPAATSPENILTTQIANRAYELYERRGRQGGHSDEDWLQAEREIKLEAIP